jgi:hypothetical protein
MNLLSPAHRKNIIPVSLFIILLIFLAPNLSGAALQLDKDTVFCCYFFISGEKPSDQDIEELCFNSGRPSYTAYKPSEMFSKKSLLSERKRIEERINTISNDPAVIWNVRLDSLDPSVTGRFLSPSNINVAIPSPTPYIGGRLSENGPQYIRKSLKAILDGAPSKRYENGALISITLRPVHGAHEFEKRNIVEQNVTLPIRYVIFQPIKVRIVDENSLNNQPDK